ncbi:hypothetical protein E2C01_096653 [Portunus trituberculatus]|uniref:Uncharacterized protein n=1 Tax=Portunus trituberculatus TaxID=210409 RepID=A0A5B7K7E5_PORTR|nr:hypothetical protein [Portunus trituberculatus]
MGRTTRQK